MSKNGERFGGAAVAFGVAAVWATAGLSSALLCLLAAGAGFGLVFALQRVRAVRPDAARHGRRVGSGPAGPRPVRSDRRPRPAQPQHRERVGATLVAGDGYGW
jgi:hypothetical protein